MSLAPVGGGYTPAPYDIGASDLAQAQSDAAKLSQLKVTKDTYETANSRPGFWIWGHSKKEINDAKNQINEQIGLEKSISTHLSNIAKASAYGQKLSPEIMPEALSVADQLDHSLLRDLAAAAEGAGEKSSWGKDAVARGKDCLHVVDGLSWSDKPDVIPLSDRSSFMKQVQEVDAKIQSDSQKFKNGPTQADKDAAKAELLGPDRISVAVLSIKIDKQIELWAPRSVFDGGSKADALPDDDPQKQAYIQLSKDLTSLVSRGDGKDKPDGVLYNDASLIADAMPRNSPQAV